MTALFEVGFVSAFGLDLAFGPSPDRLASPACVSTQAAEHGNLEGAGVPAINPQVSAAMLPRPGATPTQTPTHLMIIHKSEAREPAGLGVGLAADFALGLDPDVGFRSRSRERSRYRHRHL